MTEAYELSSIGPAEEARPTHPTTIGYEPVDYEAFRVNEDFLAAEAAAKVAGLKMQLADTEANTGPVARVMARKAITGLHREIVTNQYMANIHSERREAYGQSISEGISRFREQLKDIKTREAPALDWAVAGRLPQHFEGLRTCEVQDEAGKPLGRARFPLAVWLADVRLSTDEQVLNFLQWNQFDVDSLASDPTTQEALQASRESFRKALFGAVADQNYLPHSSTAATAYIKAKKVPINLCDVFVTDAKGRGGFYYKGQIGLGVRAVREHMEKDNLDELVWHEMVHATLGGLHEPMWLDEALTEHITQVLRWGQPETVEPAERKQDSGVYSSERKLLATLLTLGKQAVSVRLGMSAYMSDTRVNFAFNSWKEKIDAGAREAWQYDPYRNILTEIDREVDELQGKIEKKGVPAGLAQSYACERIAESLKSH